ncbi:hypothetical protein PMAYCL1PPCAC_04486, partial [Pristionchus mayeri]
HLVSVEICVVSLAWGVVHAKCLLACQDAGSVSHDGGFVQRWLTVHYHHVALLQMTEHPVSVLEIVAVGREQSLSEMLPVHVVLHRQIQPHSVRLHDTVCSGIDLLAVSHVFLEHSLVEKVHRLSKSELLGEDLGDSDLINIQVRIRRDDGSESKVHTLSHHVHAEQTLLLLEDLLYSRNVCRIGLKKSLVVDSIHSQLQIQICVVHALVVGLASNSLANQLDESSVFLASHYLRNCPDRLRSLEQLPQIDSLRILHSLSLEDTHGTELDGWHQHILAEETVEGAETTRLLLVEHGEDPREQMSVVLPQETEVLTNLSTSPCQLETRAILHVSELIIDRVRTASIRGTLFFQHRLLLLGLSVLIDIHLFLTRRIIIYFEGSDRLLGSLLGGLGRSEVNEQAASIVVSQRAIVALADWTFRDTTVLLGPEKLLDNLLLQIDCVLGGKREILLLGRILLDPVQFTLKLPYI